MPWATQLPPVMRSKKRRRTYVRRINLPSFQSRNCCCVFAPTRRPSDRHVGLVLIFLGLPALASRRLAQALIEIRMVRFQMVDDLEVLFFHAAEIDPLDMDEPQQLANRLGHRAAAFVPRAAALCYADPGPEFLLVQAQTPADFPRVDEFKDFHARSCTAEIWRCPCQLHGACQGRNRPSGGFG